MKSTINKIIFLFRPFLVLSITNLISLIQLRLFEFYIHIYEMDYDINDTLFYNICFVFYLLIFNSIVNAFIFNDSIERVKFLETFKKSKKFSKVKFVLSTPFFYIDSFLIAVSSILFQSSFFHFYASKILLNNENLSFKVILIVVPVLIIIEFLSRVQIAKKWVRGINQIVEDEGNDTVNISKILKKIIFSVLIYCVGTTILVWFLPPIMALNKASNGKLIFVLIFGIIISAVIVFTFYSLRAILKRKTFINKLKKYCANNAVKISNIQNPYRSIFTLNNSFNFTVEKNQLKYDCKFMSSIFPGSPIILSDTGYCIKHTRISVFKIQLFSRMKDFKFAFESENKKILIVVPISKNILISIGNSKLTPADTGEKIGEYTLYNANGFLNSLDRDCL